MVIIVTGGAGFIGSNFVFHMLKTYPDYRIICLDKLTYAGNLSTLKSVMDNPNFRFVKEDITDREASSLTSLQKATSTEASRILLSSFRQTSSAQAFSWMRAGNTASRDITRYLLTRFTEIFLWTALTCSLRKRHPSTRAHLTAHPRPVPIFSYWHTIEPLVCPLRSHAAQITTDLTTSRKSSSP